MTVIAWDGKTLAADKRVSCNDYPATTTKIRRAPGGELMGSCGDSDAGRALMAWFAEGAAPPSYPDNRRGEDGCRATMMVIACGGEVSLYHNGPHPTILENKFHAIGSGSDFALAVMHMGHDARKAVEVAIALDTGCGNGIDTLELR